MLEPTPCKIGMISGTYSSGGCPMYLEGICLGMCDLEKKTFLVHITEDSYYTEFSEDWMPQGTKVLGKIVEVPFDKLRLLPNKEKNNVKNQGNEEE